MRNPSEREYIHERLGERFAESLSIYDTTRRLDVLIDEFLPGDLLYGKKVLEVGTGLGYFAERLMSRGADLTVMDLGPSLVENVRRRLGCAGWCGDALMLADHFASNHFDVVVSSECIEHTPDPAKAVAQMMAVLKPGGLLSLSTPNLLWHPVVRLATVLRARPFDGLENFSTFADLHAAISQNSGVVLREKGLHLFPFQLPLHSLSTWFDENLQFARRVMINICLLARKIG